MPLPRRAFLSGAAASAAALTVPRFAIAETPVGAGTLMTISDGYLALPRSFILGSLPQDEAGPILAAAGISGDTVQSPCNVTLYRDDTRTILFDAGSGAEFMPTAGELFAGLDAAGIAPGDITHLVFTHGHPDHLWGLLDDFGDPAFPNAEFMIGQDEFDYWMNPGTVDAIGEARQVFAVGAKRRLEVIADQLAFFSDGDEILPGIAAMATYGHTPGHMSFQVGATDPVYVIGDAIANGHVALFNPAWELGSDQDPGQAAQTRASLVARLAAEQARVVGFHFPDGGFGRLAPAETGFTFVGEDQ